MIQVILDTENPFPNQGKDFQGPEFFSPHIVYFLCSLYNKVNKKAVLPQGNRVMLQVFSSVEVRQQHSLQV